MRQQRGETLVSCLVAILIVGLSIPAAIELSGASTKSISESARLTQGVALANDVLEYGVLLQITDPDSIFGLRAGETPSTCTNLYGISGYTFNPPIDSGGRSIAAMPGWEQRCTVSSFDVRSPGTPVAPSNTNARLLSVDVCYRGGVVYRASRVFAPTLERN